MKENKRKKKAPLLMFQFNGLCYVCWYRDKDGEKSSNFEGGGGRLRWQNVVLTGVGEVVIGALVIDMGSTPLDFWIGIST